MEDEMFRDRRESLPSESYVSDGLVSLCQDSSFQLLNEQIRWRGLPSDESS